MIARLRGPMKPISDCAFLILIVGSLLATSASSFAQMRVVNYNIAHMQGNAGAMQSVIAAAHADDKPGFAVPVAVFVFEEVQGANVPSLTSIVNAAAPAGVTYALATFTTSTTEDNSSGAEAMYYRTDMLSEFAAAHLDLDTLGGRKTDRWRLNLNNYGPLSNNNSFYVYASHLKASNTAPDEADRLAGVTTIRANADLLNATAHIIYAGDMNFYFNTETGYQKFISVGAGQAFDALGTGSWAGGNGANPNNLKHSQSPLLSPVNGLVGGGMNDRFDFLLNTSVMVDGVGLSLIPGAYRSLGNDGVHYNLAINNGNNLYYPGQLGRSNVLAANLAAGSDHVPVIADYQIPAVMNATLAPANYGRVIQGASVNVTLTVTNTAYAVVISGADTLQYSATGSGGLSGVFSDAVTPLGDISTANFPLNTGTPGTINGSVLVTTTSQGAANPSITRNTTGTVVRHSNPSWDGASDVNRLTIPLSFDANSGVHNIQADVHNLGFDSLQAALDVDSVSAVASPFAFVNGLASNIGSTPDSLTFSIDTTGLSPGPYNANLTINTSDENLPGETTGSLSLALEITIGGVVPCAADVNQSGTVNIDDLVAVITSWGNCPRPCPAFCAADVNHDCLVNIDDLVAVITGWGSCP